MTIVALSPTTALLEDMVGAHGLAATSSHYRLQRGLSLL
jgi:hypothetical protein